MQVEHAMKIYLDHTYQGAVMCPRCHIKRNVNMAQYPNLNLGGKILKIRCNKCSYIFEVRFDFRKYYRMSVNIPGRLFSDEQGNYKHVIIASLSVAGVGFIVNDVDNIHIGDVMSVAFSLNDQLDTVLHEEIVIRRIDGYYIGAEYAHDEYNHDLDFYIMREPWIG